VLLTTEAGRAWFDVGHDHGRLAITPEQIRIVEWTLELARDGLQALAEDLYDRLFEAELGLRGLFTNRVRAAAVLPRRPIHTPPCRRRRPMSPARIE
jgi:hypothetical protein